MPQASFHWFMTDGWTDKRIKDFPHLNRFKWRLMFYLKISESLVILNKISPSIIIVMLRDTANDTNEIQGVHWIFCFPLNLVIFLNSASSDAALAFYLPGVCTHTDTERKQRKARVRNILKSSKKTEYLIDTLWFSIQGDSFKELLAHANQPISDFTLAPASQNMLTDFPTR